MVCAMLFLTSVFCCLFLFALAFINRCKFEYIHIKHNHSRKQNTPGFWLLLWLYNKWKKTKTMKGKTHIHTQFQIDRKKNNISIPVDTNKRRCKSLCTNWSSILSKPLRVAAGDYWISFSLLLTVNKCAQRMRWGKEEEKTPTDNQYWQWNSTDNKINALYNSKCAVESLK